MSYSDLNEYIDAYIIINFLEEHFNKKKMTMTEVGKYLGVNQTTVSYWVNNNSIEKLFFAVNNISLGIELVAYLEQKKPNFDFDMAATKFLENKDNYNKSGGLKKIFEYENMIKTIKKYISIISDLRCTNDTQLYPELKEIEQVLKRVHYYLLNEEKENPTLSEFRKKLSAIAQEYDKLTKQPRMEALIERESRGEDPYILVSSELEAMSKFIWEQKKKLLDK